MLTIVIKSVYDFTIMHSPVYYNLIQRQSGDRVWFYGQSEF